MAADSMNDLIALCKRRGFIFQGSDIYGGLQGTYDFGPLGVELKNNLKAAWWRSIVHERDDVEGLDASILTHRLVLKHSGHETTFTDPMVDCRSCKSRLRADHLKDNKCSVCGGTDLTEPRPFNLMFKTTVGAVVDDENFAYLRPETAQCIFTNFKAVLDSTSRKPPFGIAQIGKAFRNEITPRNFIFRVREFEQMELEFFVLPGEDDKWHKYWVDKRMQWWQDQGLSAENLQPESQGAEDLSHYSKETVDILYKYPHGYEELEGIANRTDYDLGSHTKAQADYNIQAKVEPNSDSVAKLGLKHPETNEDYIPFVIEPSAGVERGVLALLTEAYTEEQLAEGKSRVVLKLKPHLAPVKAAVIPLAKNNPEIVECAKALRQSLQGLGLGRVMYESTGNIGKGYRRHDEIGTPFCITVDFDTIGKDGDAALKDTVTLRHRDSMEQQRVAIKDLPGVLQEFFS